jgi:gamma-glutamyl hercynylcysteine S-oxide hydrolase
MCRHLAYLGPAASLRSLLIDPPHSLYRQAWAPRRQRHGAVNADGFGIGWYAGSDPVPARYRQGTPIWADRSLPDIARVVTSGAVLAAVRSATPGTASGAEAAAPFGSGQWLFSHNGAAQHWREWAERAYVTDRQASGDGQPRADDDGAGGPSLLSSLESLVDSAFLWALAVRRLRAGQAMGAALAGVIGAVEAAGGTGRFNLLLTDGHSIAATACGDTLWYRRAGDGAGASVTVASEPGDDEPGWTEVRDQHLLTATPSLVSVQPLTGPRATTATDAMPFLDDTGLATTGLTTTGLTTTGLTTTGLTTTGRAATGLTATGRAATGLTATGRAEGIVTT